MRLSRLRPLVAGVLMLTAELMAAQSSTQPEIRALYDSYQNAVRRMDSAAYMAFFTDDFSMTSPDGKTHDRAEMAKYQKVNAETTKRVNAYSVTIEAVGPLPNGDIAVIVLQKYDRDQAPIDHPDKPHNIKTSVVQRETWHQTGSGWKIRRIEEILSGPVLFDGKPMGA